MQLYAALSAREQALLTELDQLHKTKALPLTEQRDRLRIYQACLESAVQRAMSTVQSGNTELLVARSDIVATLGAMEKQPLLLEPQVDCVLDFNVNLGQLLDLLNNAGMVSDKSTCAANTTAEGSGVNLAIPDITDIPSIVEFDAQRCSRGRKTHYADFVDIVNDDFISDGIYKATYTCSADSEGNLRLSLLLRGSHINNYRQSFLCV